MQIIFLTPYQNICESPSMKLSDYIQTKQIRRADAMAALDISAPYLSQLEGGTRVPSGRLALKIAQWSKGKVKAEDFYETEG